MDQKIAGAENNPAENKWVTIARYDQIIEADVMKSLLTSEGIIAELADAHMVSSFGLISNSLGGIRLQVPEHSAEAAYSLLNDFAAGLIQLEDTESEEIAVPVPESLPALWHPDWAAIMGLFFGPLFPIFLHYQNWQSLNKPAESRRALIWLLITLAVTLGILVFSLWTDGSFQYGNVYLSLAWGLILIVWYFNQGRSLSSFVVHWAYPKRAWGLAMLAGTITVLALSFFFKYLSVQPFLLPARVATLAREMTAPVYMDEITRRIAVNADGITLTLLNEADIDQLDEEQLSWVRSKVEDSICNNAKVHSLLVQGMIMKIKYVNSYQQPLAFFQIGNADCAALYLQ
jgi:hypothetical protein